MLAVLPWKVQRRWMCWWSKVDALRRCTEEEVLAGKNHLASIVCVLIGLIKANSDYRLHEGISDQRD
jgi:hypothetical protein